ncbi:MAG: N-acetyltransferase [Bacillota bacterium]|nr:N-acetyltransferase [Bacillota bacterium]
MVIDIIKAESKHLNDCTTALQNSELGRVYFPDEDKAVQAINEGLSRGEISAAINKDGECLGFIWVIPNGVFHSFPYLHIIAVKEQYRSLGIGKKLMSYFEEKASKYTSKVFLVVGDFNPKAKQLYQNVGYKEIGVLPNLYKKGVNECLMMKEL